MMKIPEARRKWLAERLRKIAAKEADQEVADSFVRLAEDVEAGLASDEGPEEN